MKILVAATAAALAVTGAAFAASAVYTDTVAVGKPLSIAVTTHRAASFRVVLRTSTQGRTQLFLLGRNAPKGGALIDTKTYACEGAAGSFYCRGAYEPLPAGTYTWRIVRAGGPAAHVTLTLTW